MSALLFGNGMKGMVKGSGGSPRGFPVSHLVLTAGLASVHRLCCHGPRAKERPVGASPCGSRMGLSVGNNLRKDLVWEVEIGCGDDGLKCGRGWGPTAMCAQRVCVH